MDWVFVSGVAFTELVHKIIYRILEKETSEKTRSEKLSEHTSSLTKASSEVDSVLSEMAQVAKERDASVKTSEKGLKVLEKWEKELKDKIGLLQNVPIPVAEHFAKLVEPAEKRSARRDYILFMAGVIVTTITALFLQIGFWN